MPCHHVAFLNTISIKKNYSSCCFHHIPTLLTRIKNKAFTHYVRKTICYIKWFYSRVAAPPCRPENHICIKCARSMKQTTTYSPMVQHCAMQRHKEGRIVILLCGEMNALCDALYTYVHNTMRRASGHTIRK